MRRRRGGRATGFTSRKSGTPKGSTQPAAENQTAGNHQSSLPLEIAIPTPRVGQIFPDPGSQSMQQAMQQFDQNSKAPVAKEQKPPGSKKQAMTNTSTRPPKAKSTAPPSQPVPAQPVPAQSVPAQSVPAQSVPAQPAPPVKPGGTYWPESKKTALAEAAQIALTSTPHNQAKTISTQDIHELLDQNPSYTQMCEILEYRGFVIDRGQFARTLLKAVPDLGAASNAASTNTASATRATPTNATPAVTASTNDTTTTIATNIPPAKSATPTLGTFGILVKTTVNGSAAPKKIHQSLPYSVPPAAAFPAPNGYITPYAPAPTSAEQASKGNQSHSGLPRNNSFIVPPSWTPDEPRHHASVTNQARLTGPALHSHPLFSLQQSGSTNSQSLNQNGTTNANGVIPHHPTKQEMARKRTFGEILDLTQTLSDDEELERYRPKPRTDNESASDPSKSVGNIFNHVTQRQQNSGRTTPKPFKYKYSGRDALLQSYDIVEPMNKRRDALRRSTYNPKTIARDVLLGLGKHPTMAPLNAHLDVLKDRFKAVDYESDLTTFRWDLVDPEGDGNAGTFDTDDEEAVPAVAAIRQPPAPVAVMVDGGSGNVAKDVQPPSRTANFRAKPYKRGPYKKTGIRSGIQPTGSADTPQPQSLQGSPYPQNIGNVPSTNAPDLSRFAYNSPYTAGPNLKTNASSPSAPESVSKHRGRPPGAKKKQVRPDKGISKKTKTLSVHETPSTANPEPSYEATVGKTPKIPPVGSFSIGEPSAPILTTPRLTTTTPTRPSGLRNSISAITPTDGIAVVIPSRSPSVVIFSPQASAKKSRPKKTEDLSSGRQASAPSYTIYRCHWENCPAELHSLETLKKHVRKHRGAVDDVYPCLWADCSDSSNPISNRTQNKDGQRRRLKYKSEAEWINHMESNHLRTKLENFDGLSAQSSGKSK